MFILAADARSRRHQHRWQWQWRISDVSVERATLGCCHDAAADSAGTASSSLVDDPGFTIVGGEQRRCLERRTGASRAPAAG